MRKFLYVYLRQCNLIKNEIFTLNKISIINKTFFLKKGFNIFSDCNKYVHEIISHSNFTSLTDKITTIN